MVNETDGEWGGGGGALIDKNTFKWGRLFEKRGRYFEGERFIESLR